MITNFKLNNNKIILSLIAIFVMFLPRGLSILNSYSFRIVVLFAFFLAFVIFRKKLIIDSFLYKPPVIIYLSVVVLVYIMHSEYVSLFGYLLDTVVLFVLLTSFLVDKIDIEFFINLFSKMLIIYALLCIIECFTGFNIWTTIGVENDAAGYMRYGLYRAYGSFTTSINNGVFMLLCFPVLRYALNTYKQKRMYMISYALVWITLLLTLSRAPIIAAVALHLLWLFSDGVKDFFKKHLTKVILFIIALICLSFFEPFTSFFQSFIDMFVSLVNPEVAEEISDEFGSNAEGAGQRFLLYSWVWEAVQGNIWFGKGPNTIFEYVWYPDEWNVAVKNSIENQYLSQLYRFGIVGLISVVCFYLSTIIYTFKSKAIELKERKKNTNSFQYLLCTTLIAYFGVLFTVGVADDLRMFYILLALSVAFNRIYKKNEDKDEYKSPLTDNRNYMR